MAYGTLLVPLRNAETEATATTAPLVSSKCGIAARMSSRGPVTLVRITSSQVLRTTSHPRSHRARYPR
ncbi:hypothetical protein SGLAM104S_06466 [Streptomyces glaucescens]